VQKWTQQLPPVQIAAAPGTLPSSCRRPTPTRRGSPASPAPCTSHRAISTSDEARNGSNPIESKPNPRRTERPPSQIQPSEGEKNTERRMGKKNTYGLRPARSCMARNSAFSFSAATCFLSSSVLRRSASSACSAFHTRSMLRRDTVCHPFLFRNLSAMAGAPPLPLPPETLAAAWPPSPFPGERNGGRGEGKRRRGSEPREKRRWYRQDQSRRLRLVFVWGRSSLEWARPTTQGQGYISTKITFNPLTIHKVWFSSLVKTKFLTTLGGYMLGGKSDFVKWMKKFLLYPLNYRCNMFYLLKFQNLIF